MRSCWPHCSPSRRGGRCRRRPSPRPGRRRLAVELVVARGHRRRAGRARAGGVGGSEPGAAAGSWLGAIAVVVATPRLRPPWAGAPGRRRERRGRGGDRRRAGARRRPVGARPRRCRRHRRGARSWPVSAPGGSGPRWRSTLVALVAGVASLVAIGQGAGTWSGTLPSSAVAGGRGRGGGGGTLVLVVQAGRSRDGAAPSLTRRLAVRLKPSAPTPRMPERRPPAKPAAPPRAPPTRASRARSGRSPGATAASCGAGAGASSWSG